MTTMATIFEHSVLARKRGDKVEAGILGLVLAEVQNICKADNNRQSATEADVSQAVKRLLKKNAQSLSFKQTEQLLEEKRILEQFMPEATDTDIDVGPILEKLFSEHPDKAEAARANPGSQGWFVGQVMKATGGKANAATVKQAVSEALS